MRSAFLTLLSVAFASGVLWASQVQTLPHNAERVPRNSSGQENRIGALYFDPLGADFTAWVKQFKNETYRNWILPQAVSKGAQGCTQIQFTVSQGGHIASLHVTEPSGEKALDRAAEIALRKSNFLRLPADYPAQSVAVEVAFFYNSEPLQQPRLCTAAQSAKEQDGRSDR
jgi:TonB family protein